MIPVLLATLNLGLVSYLAYRSIRRRSCLVAFWGFSGLYGLHIVIYFVRPDLLMPKSANSSIALTYDTLTPMIYLLICTLGFAAGAYLVERLGAWPKLKPEINRKSFAWIRSRFYCSRYLLQKPFILSYLRLSWTTQTSCLAKTRALAWLRG